MLPEPALRRALPPLAATPAAVPSELLDVDHPSGVRVVAARCDLPVSQVALVLPARPSSWAELAADEALAACLLDSCGDGVGAVEQTLEHAAAAVACRRDASALVIAGQALREHDRLVTDVVAEALALVAVRPAALDARLPLLRHHAALASTSPATSTRRAFLEVLHGDRPDLHDVPRPEDLAVVGYGDVVASAARVLRASAATVVAVGPDPADLADDLGAALDRHLADAPRRAHTPPVVASRPAVLPAGVRRADRAHAVQSQVRLALPALARDDPRFAAVSLATAVFGGTFSSRLTTDLRERRGLAYHVHARLDRHGDEELLAVDVDTASTSTRAALDVVREHVEAMRRRPPSRDEVDRARHLMAGAALLTSSSQAGVIAGIASAVRLGRSVADDAELLDRVWTTDLHDVAEAAAEVFDPDRLAGVVVTAPGTDLPDWVTR